MTSRKDRTPDAGGLIVALALANSGRPYLGDPHVVDTLLRDLSYGMVQRDIQVGEGAP